MSNTETQEDPLVTAVAALNDARRSEEKAKARLTRAQADHSQAWAAMVQCRAQLAETIADEARKGRRNADIRKVTSLTSERIRQICRAAGVAPLD